MIRVAFLQTGLEIGGAERLVQSLVRSMDHGRIESLVVNLYEPGALGEELRAEGRPVTSGLAASRLDPRVGWRLARTFREQRADVVHVLDSAMPMFWVGLLRRLSARPRLVIGFHSSSRLEAQVQHFVSRAAAVRAADRLVALSESHRRLLARMLVLPESRFDVVGSGVDLVRFQTGLPRDEARRQAGLPRGGPLAGIVAALRPEKNHELFLRAAKRISQRLPEARFVVAGDGPERTRLERLRDQLGLADRVRMLGLRQDVPVLQRALDVATLSSNSETLPVTLIEAAACGTPAVATDVGSARDVVSDGETGFIVPAGDESGLADRLYELLAGAPLRERMGIAARRHAERNFDARDMLHRYERLFIDVAGGQS